MKPNEFKCMKCGGFKLERPDKIPLCSECEKKMTQDFASRIRPDIGRRGKVVLKSEVE